MTALVIAYPPSGGGNHLKNILCLDTSFGNSSDLNTEVYASGDREVHSTAGRNVSAERVSAAANDPHSMHIIHGHFGELATQRDQINAIIDKKFVVISIDTDRDRYLLNERQHRLGQFGHDYYLNEEQPYLYQSYFYQTYFTGLAENIYTIALNDFWHPDLQRYEIIDRLNSFLNKNVDFDKAQALHRQWHKNNDITYY